MKIVSAYKPFEAVVPSQEGFDWLAALKMLAHSAKVYSHCETYAITDQALPVPHYRFETKETQLMLWILEVSIAYIESEHFDQDTVFLSPDSLVRCNLLDGFDGSHLGVMVRPADKYKERPLLNSLQFWPVAAKHKLAAFFRRCLKIARELPEDEKRWGGDTTPLVMLLSPIEADMTARAGMVVRQWPYKDWLHTIGSGDMNALDSGEPVRNRRAVIDFKASKKRYMARYYRSMFR